MPVLFRAEYVARPADFKIAHRQFVAAAEFRELHDRFQSFRSGLRHHAFRFIGEIGVREPRAAPHSATELIQLRNSQPLGIDDDQRIRVGQIDAVFDDRGGDEYVRLARIKIVYVVFQHRFIHAPVRHGNFRFGHDRGDLRGERINTLHAVVQNKHLPVAGKFADACVADQRFRLFRHVRLHGQTGTRRRLNRGNIPDPRKRHMQRARNRRRRHGEAVDILAHVFDLFFMLHAETLFFVQYQKPKIFEMHVDG